MNPNDQQPNYNPQNQPQMPPVGQPMPQPVPPQYDQAYQPNQAYYQQIQPEASNGMAVAGFVLAFLIGLLGLIFSILGLNKSKELNGKGKGLSIAGIIISSFNMLLGVILVATDNYPGL